MAVKVYDKAAQKVVEVAAADAQDLVLRGEVELVDERVRVAKGVRTGTVAREHLADAVGSGARLVDDEEAQTLTVEREESDFGSATLGAVEGAAAGATLGLSSVALEALGVDPERMAARRRAAGPIGTGAEIAGGLVPALLTGGGSTAASGAAAAGRMGLAARIARATPAGALERAGARAGEALAGRAVGSGATSLAATKLLPAGGRLFVEGAGAGIGAEIDESVLGDRELAADRLASAGLIGGALGVAGGAGIVGLAKVSLGAVKAPIKGMQRVLGRNNAASGGEATAEVAELAVRSSDELPRLQRWWRDNAIAQGADPEVADRLARASATREGKADIARLERERPRIEREAAELIAETVPRVHESMRAARMAAGGESKATYWERLGPRTPEQQVAAVGEIDALVKQHRAALDAMAVNNRDAIATFGGGAPYEGSLMWRAHNEVARLEREMMDAVHRPGGKASSTAAAMAADRYKRVLGEMIDDAGGWSKNMGGADGPTKATNLLLRQRYREVQELLMREDIFGDAAVAQKKINAAFVKQAAADGDYRDATAGTGLGTIVNPDGTFNAFKAVKLVRAHGRTGGDVAVARLMDSMDARVEYFKEIANHVELDDTQRAALQQVEADVAMLRREFKRQAKDAAMLDDLLELRRVEGLGSPSLLTAGSSLAGILGFSVGGVPGAVLGAGLVAARQPYTTLHRYAAIMSALDASDSQLRGVVDGMVDVATRGWRAAERFAAKPTPAFTRTGAAAARSAGQGVREERAKRSARRQESIDKAIALLNDPEGVTRALSVPMHSLYDVAPGVAGVVQARLSVAAEFLASKAPKVYVRGDVRMVDPVSAASYDRYYEAVVDPYAALRRFEAGRITQEAAEAIRIVYPALWADLQAQVVDRLSQLEAEGKPATFNGRMLLGQTFGMDTDPSLVPAVAQVLQASASPPPPAPPGQQAAPAKSRLGKMTHDPKTTITAADRAAEWKSL